MSGRTHPGCTLGLMVLLAPCSVFTFGPEVESDPLGMLEALVQGHKDSLGEDVTINHVGTRGNRADRTMGIPGETQRSHTAVARNEVSAHNEGRNSFPEGKRRTLVLQGKLRESGHRKRGGRRGDSVSGGECDSCDRVEWDPVGDNSLDQYSLSNWEPRKEVTASSDLDDLNAPKVRARSDREARRKTKSRSDEKIDRIDKHYVSKKRRRSKRPRDEGFLPSLPDPQRFPETIKMSSTFSGRPMFSVEPDKEGGGLRISPPVTHFQLEMEDKDKLHPYTPPRKMNRMLTQDPGREMTSVESEGFGFGEFPDFDTNIRGSFFDFGSDVSKTNPKPRVRPKVLYQSRAPASQGLVRITPKRKVSTFSTMYKEPTSNVESYQAPKRSGEASNLYVEDPWKDVNPVTILTDSPPYNPHPAYDQEDAFSSNPDFPSFTSHSDYNPQIKPHSDPFVENSYQPEPYKPEPAYSPKPNHPEPLYSPKPNHLEPAYNPEPYHSEPAYSPKPYTPESVYSSEPYHPEPAYSPKPNHPEPAYSLEQYNPKPYKPEPAYSSKPYQSEPAYATKPYKPEPEYSLAPFHHEPESYHPKPDYKPKPTYHYKKPNYRPPIGSKPYNNKPHDVIKVSIEKPSYKPDPHYEPEVHHDPSPYHQTHHDGDKYHDKHSDTHYEPEVHHDPSPYHQTHHEGAKYHDKHSDTAPIHDDKYNIAPFHDTHHKFASFGDKHHEEAPLQDSYHKPSSNHHSEPHIQLEQYSESKPFFTQNHDLEVFHEFNPEVPINPFNDVRKSDSDSDSIVYRKSHKDRPRMTRLVDRNPGEKAMVAHRRPGTGPTKEPLPFLDPQPGGSQLQHQVTGNGFLHEFNIPEFDTFHLEKDIDIHRNTFGPGSFPAPSYTRRDGSRDLSLIGSHQSPLGSEESRDSSTIRMSNKLFPVSDVLSESSKKFYGA